MKFPISTFRWFKGGKIYFRRQRKLIKAMGQVKNDQRQYAQESATRLAAQPKVIEQLPHSPQEKAISHTMTALTQEVSRRTGHAIGELTTIAKEEASAIAKSREDRDQDLEEQAREQLRKISELNAQTEDALKAEHKKLEDLGKEEQEHSKALSEARKKAEIPEGRPGFSRFLPWFVFLIEVICVVGEYAANLQLIEWLLREDGLVAKLFSLGLSVALVVFAHKLGVYVAKLSQGKWSKWLVSIKAGLTFLAVAAAVGLLRTVMASGEADIGDDEMTSWAIGALIAFMPTAAFYMALFAYDPKADLKKTYSHVLRKLRRTKGDIKKGKKTIASITAKKHAQEQKINDTYDKYRRKSMVTQRNFEAKAFKRLSRACKALNVTLSTRQTLHNGIESESRELVYRFRAHLTDHLTDNLGKLPDWLSQDISPLEIKDEEFVEPGSLVGYKPIQVSKGLSVLVGLLCLFGLTSCDSFGKEEHQHVVIETLIDRSDSMIIATPMVHASDLTSLAHLGQGEDGARTTVHVGTTEIGASAFAPRVSVDLLLRGRENAYNNLDSIASFSKDLELMLSEPYRPLEDEPENSRIYIAMCEALTRLKSQEGETKVMVVHSDYLEHSEVSLYRDGKLLTKNPSILEKRFCDMCPLPRLDGITIYLLTTATDKADALIIEARNFFKQMFQALGAKVFYSFSG